MGGRNQRHDFIRRLAYHPCPACSSIPSTRRANVNFHGFVMNISRDFGFGLKFHILVGLYGACYGAINNCMGNLNLALN